MIIFKCKMCGGDLPIVEGNSTCECEFCGTKQTIPQADNEKNTNMFNRANRLRMNAEFDRAASVYVSITAEFPEEAEAYWGLCLCKYGIEYVDDPATGNKIPTCHRTLTESILDDNDFIQACEYADPVAKRLYREEAKTIDQLQQDILSIVANEPPYDVFICYKEKDQNDDRTEDSVFAQEIYDSLTGKGLKVFFARITLEDKLGQQYEPYIYAALYSAKVMLVVGTQFEYFDAVWVKNEWVRFLDMMRNNKEKTLIPCFKGIDAYDIPREFTSRRLQAQDMGKLGWLQDLTRGVLKLCGKESIQNVNVTANAEEAIGGNFGYFILDDGTAEITEYHGSSKRIKIPSVISGHAVKKIGVCAFRDSQIINVSLPDGIVEIGEEAFAGCDELRSLTLPYGTTRICDEAFSGCIALSSITIPYSVQNISDTAFYGCEKLIIQGERDSIAYNYAFKNCIEFIDILEGFSYEESDNRTIIITNYRGNEDDLVIPNHIQGRRVSQIADRAFLMQKNLKKIKIPAGITKIGEYCFSECEDLEEVEIADTVVEIAGGAFNKCGKLQTISLPRMLSKIKEWTFCECQLLSKIVLPAGLECIEKGAFYNCISLDSISLPKSTITIGDDAFFQCLSLKRITIPRSTIDIGKSVFSLCSSLIEIEVEVGNKAYNSIDGVLYTHDFKMLIQYPAGSKTKNYEVNTATEIICSESFAGCKYLSFVKIPKSVSLIEKNAFGSCERLERIDVSPEDSHYSSSDGVLFLKDESILVQYPTGKSDEIYEIPAGTISIAECAFCGTKALKIVHLPKCLREIKDCAFQLCSGLSMIEIPDSVSQIGTGAFAGCNFLQTITLPNALKELSEFVFNGCTMLKEITIPDSIESIHSHAFSGCVELNQIAIPSRVVSIGNYAFSGCKGLKTLSIKEGLQEIGEYAFLRCSALHTLDIPNTVHKISTGAFIACQELQKITFGQSEIVFGDSVFQECASLYSISIPGTVLQISNYMFSNCTSLVSVEIGDGLCIIGQNAFYQCANLQSITIPGSVSSINEYAFQNCSNLKTVEIKNGMKCIDSGAFDGCDNLQKLIIPESVTEFGTWIVNMIDKPINLKIYGIHNSVAGEYARENEIPFVEYDPQKMQSVKNQTTSETADKRAEYEPSISSLQQNSVNKKQVSVEVEKQQRRIQGLCEFCGGKFNLFKRCKLCGKRKTY